MFAVEGTGSFSVISAQLCFLGTSFPLSISTAFPTVSSTFSYLEWEKWEKVEKTAKACDEIIANKKRKKNRANNVRC